MKKASLFLILTSFLIFYTTNGGSNNIDIVVSQDGLGNYSTISQAISAIPNNSINAYTVYIKEGVYTEAVSIGSEKNIVTIIGDGVGRTIITFNKSQSSGYPMDLTATLNVQAAQFVAKDISFVNSAGFEAGPALAVRSAGESEAYYRCSFEGYQDTMFLIYGRKFFGECTVYGTVDFICGDAAIIFQNSNILIRPRQLAVIVAERRDNSVSTNGIVLHNCTIDAASNPQNVSIDAFLGRPWKGYARTIVMQSYLGGLIDPRGWTLMSAKTNLSNIFYREYANTGPGASTADRVKWPGFKVITSPSDALQFTVQQFINGSDWLPSTGIPYIPGLI